MEIVIRKALEEDRDTFVSYVEKLSRYNRSKHSDECKYDDYEAALAAIREKAEVTFLQRNEDTLILIAEINGRSAGYALGRIYEEDGTADNGTGRIGLFDELYVEEHARGCGLGRRLIDEVTGWMKEKGIRRMKLHAYSWNAQAISLYEYLGFKEYAVSYEKFI